MKTQLIAAVTLTLTLSAGGASADPSPTVKLMMELAPMAQVLAPTKHTEPCQIRWVKPPTPAEQAAAEASCRAKNHYEVTPMDALLVINR